MSDTPNGETVNVEPPKNDATTTVQPVTPPAPAPAEPVKTEDNAVEELRKKLEQQEMRANQLQNQLKTKEEADAKAKEKELEEQNQFKELFEQEKAKREALEQEQQTKEKQEELDKAKNETLKEFPEGVKQAAEKLGLTLLDTDESSVAAFKEKLAVLSESVKTETQTTPNNPKAPSTSNVDLTTDQLRETLQDDNAFHELMVKKFPGVASMTKQQ